MPQASKFASKCLHENNLLINKSLPFIHNIEDERMN